MKQIRWILILLLVVPFAALLGKYAYEYFRPVYYPIKRSMRGKYVQV